MLSLVRQLNIKVHRFERSHKAHRNGNLTDRLGATYIGVKKLQANIGFDDTLLDKVDPAIELVLDIVEVPTQLVDGSVENVVVLNFLICVNIVFITVRGVSI